MGTRTDDIADRIDQRLAGPFPEVEVLACERVAAERLRLTIDHPDGVDLGLCERVTKELRDMLADYSLEVSSPGPERPLTKPDHFRRFLGRRARVRTREPRNGGPAGTAGASPASWSAPLTTEVTVAADSGVVSIPYEEISRSNLLQERREA